MPRKTPDWWDWDLDLSPHPLRWMADREFTELDLRAMLDGAGRVRPDAEAGRWRVFTRVRGRPWRIIVEPDLLQHVLVVVTAFLTGQPDA